MGKDYIESLAYAVSGAVDTVRPISKCVPIIIAARFSGVAEKAGWSRAVASKMRRAQGALALPLRFVEYETNLTLGGAPFSTDCEWALS